MAWTLLVAAVLALSGAKADAAWEKLKLLGMAGGVCRGVDTLGSLAVIGEGASLTVLDVSDPAKPRAVSRVPLAHVAGCVRVAGKLALVGDISQNFLQIVDLTDPTAPVSHPPISVAGNVKDIAVRAALAYVACGDAGLAVYDLSDPAAPVLLRACVTPADAMGVALGDGVACVAVKAKGLEIMNLADPTSPTTTCVVALPGSAMDVALSGPRALVALGDTTNGLQVVDLTTPGAPVLKGLVHTTACVFSVRVAADGASAYLADRNYTLEVIDLTDPDSPVLGWQYATVDTPARLALLGSLALVAENASLKIFDVADPKNPVLAGSYGTPGSAYRVALDGDKGLVADFFNGLEVFDVSNPRLPTLSGEYPMDVADNVKLSNGKAILTDYQKSVLQVDYQGGGAPTLLGTAQTTGTLMALGVQGDRVYILNNDASNYSNPAVKLFRIDFAQPGPPVVQMLYSSAYDSSDAPIFARDVATSGTQAFFTQFNTNSGYGYSAGLNVITVDGSTHPPLVSTTIDTSSSMFVTALDLAGDNLYLGGPDSLTVYNLTRQQTINSASVGSLRDVRVAGSFVFALTSDGMLKVIDLSNPTPPLSSFSSYGPFPAPPEGVTVNGNLVCVADGVGGLMVLGDAAAFKNAANQWSYFE